jgi:hypothetical protein
VSEARVKTIVKRYTSGEGEGLHAPPLICHLYLHVIMPRNDLNHLGHHDAVDHGPEDHEDGYEEQLRRAGRGNVAKADGREDRVYEIDTWAENAFFENAFFENFCKFLAGSFSAVSKRNFARKYAFNSIFQALQDLHPFTPLQSPLI